jgi:hypothetical protein
MMNTRDLSVILKLPFRWFHSLLYVLLLSANFHLIILPTVLSLVTTSEL